MGGGVLLQYWYLGSAQGSPGERACVGDNFENAGMRAKFYFGRDCKTTAPVVVSSKGQPYLTR
jgi:hypothetical protein